MANNETNISASALPMDQRNVQSGYISCICLDQMYNLPIFLRCVPIFGTCLNLYWNVSDLVGREPTYLFWHDLTSLLDCILLGGCEHMEVKFVCCNKQTGLWHLNTQICVF